LENDPTRQVPKPLEETLAGQEADQTHQQGICAPRACGLLDQELFHDGLLQQRLQTAAPLATAQELWRARASLARLGLGIHVPAPTIHAGFGSKEGDSTYDGSALQLEIWNVGSLCIVLDAGIPIGQLIFEEVHGTPEKGYAGRFAVPGPEVVPPTPTAAAAPARKRRRR